MLCLQFDQSAAAPTFWRWGSEIQAKASTRTGCSAKTPPASLGPGPARRQTMATTSEAGMKGRSTFTR